MSPDLSTPQPRGDARDQTTSAEAMSMSTFAGGLPMRQTRRSISRTLALAPETLPDLSAVRVGQARLDELAAELGVEAAGAHTLVLLTDPTLAPAAKWEWQLQLPIRGAVNAETLGDARIERVPGGTYVEVRVPGGMAALDAFYKFFFQTFLPRYQHRLARPVVVHRLLGDLEARDPKTLDVLVAVPVVLSIGSES